MVSKERTDVFINSLDSGNSPLLDAIETESIQTNVPIIRKDMQGFLKFILAIRKPERILEVGTATGFSALLMAENTSSDTLITTIEKYEKRIPVAKENFKRAEKENRITLLEGDASDILKELTGEFDFIFMDAAKGQYLSFLPDVLRLLTPGGMLITDNVLQDGDVLESRYAVTRRNRTIHNRMREYLYELKNHPALDTVILTVGDGIAVSVKKTDRDM